MKLIFLDIDGVLITRDYADKCGSTRQFDPECVERLNRITDETGAKFVISSSWRIGRSLSELRRIFKQFKVRGEVYDMTPRIGTNYSSRQQEIDLWLKFKHGIEKYIVIDDDHDVVEETAIFTDWKDGLQHKHVVEAIHRLNGTT